MLKTKGAYAFRDFDAQRILQRPFFKKIRTEYKIGAAQTDEEILKTLNATDDDSARTIRRKIDCLQDLRNVVDGYINRISRHADRLSKYRQEISNRIIMDENADIKALRARHKRASELENKYRGSAVQYGDEDFKCSGVMWLIIGKLLNRIIIQQERLDGLQTHYRKIFASRVKKARKEMTLTQAELASRLNLTQRAIGNYELGTNEPSIAMLVKLSRELNKSVDWLVGAV